MNDNTVPAADRADVGRNDNQAPDFAKLETERLVDEYQGLVNTLDELVAEVGRVPETVEDDQTALRIGGLIKRFRDLRERFENTRAVEKEPHLRRGNAVDSFFNGHKKKIQPDGRSEQRTSPGLIDVLQSLINAHQDRKEAAERDRLARAAAETARLAREAQERVDNARREEERLAREATQRRADAERARAPAQIEKKAEAATEAEKDVTAQTGAIAGAVVEAEQATDRAQEAHIATLTKPADIVRTRGVTEDGAGVTLTKAKENYAVVVDATKLDPVRLFPYFNEAEIEKAVRAFAKATNYREKMDGAEIGTRTKGVTR